MNRRTTVALLIVATLVGCGGKPHKPRQTNEFRPPTGASIWIADPKTDALVLERPLVRGGVADPNAKVWIVVQPLATGEFWVQPAVTVGSDGAWAAQIYIGQPGSKDIGKYFEVMAFANPTLALREGLVLKTWPEAQWKSQVVRVTRR